jgi:hypothetical protein
MFLIILMKSLIIGALVGVGVGVGAARMFHAPTVQGMGAFRTLGELNSCEGDPASHFSFGLGFFFNAWASSAGRRSGFWATIFGGLAQMIMGNAVPGLVLGILIGKGVEDGGWNKVTKIMLAAVITLFVMSAFFRGFDIELIESFRLTVPTWLENVHTTLSGNQ